MEGGWNIKCSAQAARVQNQIRDIADHARPSSSAKSAIKVSIGDPTLDGNLVTPAVHVEALCEAARSQEFNGYAPVVGHTCAREAVATFWGKHFVSSSERRTHIVADNIILTSGGSHAIDIAISSVCNPGDNVLVPSPGFPYYWTTCQTYGIEVRRYHLNPRRGWEPDMDEIASLADERTKMLIMTNPSNPCGSNYSREVVQNMVQVAGRLRLMLFSDEIYHGIVFQREDNPNKEFVSVADVTSDAPRIILGGTAKAFIAPGWRLGWLILVDPRRYAQDYWMGIANQAMLVGGANTLCQAALPRLLSSVDAESMSRTISLLEGNAFYFFTEVNAHCRPFLEAAMPQGSMFVMVRIALEHFDPSMVDSDQTFFEKLLDEENVTVVPGTPFDAPGFFRVVISRPKEVLAEVVNRLQIFCKRHAAIGVACEAVV